ncbi:hypothetical protein AB0J21_03415 [Streptomyces sp. NPDC049954]|uniref:hypothetical protein n=1 Tax=Streptomyces sp. NPDC049954 TaxID=3155779 RepID=UPI00343BB30B
MTAHRQRRRAAGAGQALLAVLGLTAVLGGCGGAGAAQEPDAGEALARVRGAADRLTKAEGAGTRTAMEVDSGGTRVTIRSRGRYDFAGRRAELTVLLPRDVSGVREHRPVKELLAPGALYMKNRGEGVPADKWVRVDTSGLPDGNLVTGGATDPLLAAGLLRGAGRVTYVGTEDLAGTRVRHYRGTVDLLRAAAALEGADRATLESAARGFARRSVPFDAYLDEQGLLRKVRHRFAVRDAAEGAGGAERSGAPGASASAGAAPRRALSVASTTLLFDFGPAPVVGLPAAGDIYTGRIADE